MKAPTSTTRSPGPISVASNASAPERSSTPGQGRRRQASSASAFNVAMPDRAAQPVGAQRVAHQLGSGSPGEALVAGGARRHRAADIARHRVARRRAAPGNGDAWAAGQLDAGEEQADNGALDRDRVEVAAEDR